LRVDKSERGGKITVPCEIPERVRVHHRGPSRQAGVSKSVRRDGFQLRQPARLGSAPGRLTLRSAPSRMCSHRSCPSLPLRFPDWCNRPQGGISRPSLRFMTPEPGGQSSIWQVVIAKLKLQPLSSSRAQSNGWRRRATAWLRAWLRRWGSWGADNLD
jgi:hypothetical protein